MASGTLSRIFPMTMPRTSLGTSARTATWYACAPEAPRSSGSRRRDHSAVCAREVFVKPTMRTAKPGAMSRETSSFRPVRVSTGVDGNGAANVEAAARRARLRKLVIVLGRMRGAEPIA